MGRIRALLSVTFSRNMHRVPSGAGPAFGLALGRERLDFLSINDDNVVRNTMSLVARFRTVLNICVRHYISPSSHVTRRNAARIGC